MIVIAAVSFQLVNVKSTIDIKIEVMRLFLQHNENMETSSSNVSFKLTDRQFSEFVDWGNRFAYILRIELLNIHHHRYVYRTWFFSILINISSKKKQASPKLFTVKIHTFFEPVRVYLHELLVKSCTSENSWHSILDTSQLTHSLTKSDDECVTGERWPDAR